MNVIRITERALEKLPAPEIDESEAYEGVAEPPCNRAQQAEQVREPQDDWANRRWAPVDHSWFDEARMNHPG